MADEKLNLDYEPPQPRRISVRVIRMLALPVVSIAFIVTAIYVGGVANTWWQHRQASALVARLEQECLNYSPPAGTVMFDDSLNASTQLFGPDYKPAGPHPENGVGYRPPVLDRLIAAYDADRKFPSTGVYPYPYYLTTFTGPLAVMHERHSPNGSKRLVAAGMVWFRQPGKFRMLSIKPVILQRKIVEGDFGAAVTFSGDLDLVILPATMDATDPTHFVIPIKLGTQAIDLHCWLEDGGKIKIRSSAGWLFQGKDNPEYYDLHLSPPPKQSTHGQNGWVHVGLN